MIDLAQLTGFVAAHAIWSVSDGGPLVPFVGFQKPDGSRGVTRFAADRLEDGVASAREWLAANPETAVLAVTAIDGFVTLPGGKTDAILLDARGYGVSKDGIAMAVPYRHKTWLKKFVVYRPKFISVDVQNPDYASLGEQFFAGVDSHSEAAKFWNQHIDQSQ